MKGKGTQNVPHNTKCHILFKVFGKRHIFMQTVCYQDLCLDDIMIKQFNSANNGGHHFKISIPNIKLNLFPKIMYTLLAHVIIVC